MDEEGQRVYDTGVFQEGYELETLRKNSIINFHYIMQGGVT